VRKAIPGTGAAFGPCCNKRSCTEQERSPVHSASAGYFLYLPHFLSVYSYPACLTSRCAYSLHSVGGAPRGSPGPQGASGTAGRLRWRPWGLRHPKTPARARLEHSSIGSEQWGDGGGDSNRDHETGSGIGTHSEAAGVKREGGQGRAVPAKEELGGIREGSIKEELVDTEACPCQTGTSEQKVRNKGGGSRI